MDLGFGQLVGVMSAMHPGIGPRIVQARLKYFQRLPFPSAAVRVGTGARAEYPPDAMMRTVVAFELLATGIGPQQAATLVSGTWEGLGLRLAETWAARRGDMRESLVIVRVDGLDARPKASGQLTVGHEYDLRVWIKSRDAADRRITLLDAARMMLALEAASEAALKPLMSLKLARELDRWADELMTGASELTGT